MQRCDSVRPSPELAEESGHEAAADPSLGADFICWGVKFKWKGALKTEWGWGLGRSVAEQAPRVCTRPWIPSQHHMSKKPDDGVEKGTGSHSQLYWRDSRQLSRSQLQTLASGTVPL